MNHKWAKPGLFLFVLALIAWFAPSTPIDPWQVLNPQKITIMIFFLAFIQVLGIMMNRFFGVRTGAILTGFFGGLISSTATTAALARKSKINIQSDNYAEIIGFLSATGAMLIEGIAIVCMGQQDLHFSLIIIFCGPILSTTAMIYFFSKKLKIKSIEFEDIPFEIFPIIKLTFFIISTLLLSKWLQSFFGQSGLMVLTFFVSLFEIHGSVIANVQLHENTLISMLQLSHLIAISLVASYVSKLFLIFTIGSNKLKSHAIVGTFILFLSLLVTWFISLGLANQVTN